MATVTSFSSSLPADTSMRLRKQQSVVPNKVLLEHAMKQEEPTAIATGKQDKKDLSTEETLAQREKWPLFVYRDLSGEPWDVQPACFLTDYFLAIQCFAFAIYVCVRYAQRHAEPPAQEQHDKDAVEAMHVSWYITYFIALGLTSMVGGMLHHTAYEAWKTLANEKAHQSIAQTAKIFGYQLNRATVDRVIEIMWRIVLFCSILTDFAIVSLAARHYLSDHWAFMVIVIAALGYLVLAIWANLSLHVLFLVMGYLPAMVFGAITSSMALELQYGRPLNELIVYFLKLGSGLVQGLMVSPSSNRFNHNALSHVILSLAATFMLVNFGL